MITTDYHAILRDPKIDRLPLLQEAYKLRHKHFSNKVKIHIIGNAQNGSCPEDCNYCAQSKDATSKIEEYKLKPDEEILNEAKLAYESGAFRYCMVLSGRGPKPTRVARFASLIKEIKSKYPLELCLSAGLLDSDMAKTLKTAGLDRLNHNLNTSETHYPKICTTHTYQDRLNTLLAAKEADLETCSGIIIGMGETDDDIIAVAKKLAELEVPSIPINFLVPIEGNILKTITNLTPDYCLRVLCLFRFLNPKAEIRVAAGRELHFRSLEPFALYPANSLFLEGYLNTKGEDANRVYQMIEDLGFEIDADKSAGELLANKKKSPKIEMKTYKDLHPTLS